MLSRRYRPYTLTEKNTTDPFAPTESVVEQGRGFLQPVSSSETFEHLKSDQEISARLYTNVDTVAKYGHTLTYEGSKYTVLYAFQPEGVSSVGHHKEILVGRYGSGA